VQSFFSSSHGKGLSSGERVEGAADASAACPLQDVGVNHRGLDVGVPEELLDGADVIAVLEEVCGERVPQGVAAGVFLYACGADRECNGALYCGFFEVVPPLKAAARVDGDARGGEDVLPGKVAGGAQ
jgi:hypothetical protein